MPTKQELLKDLSKKGYKKIAFPNGFSSQENTWITLKTLWENGELILKNIENYVKGKNNTNLFVFTEKPNAGLVVYEKDNCLKNTEDLPENIKKIINEFIDKISLQKTSASYVRELQKKLSEQLNKLKYNLIDFQSNLDDPNLAVALINGLSLQKIMRLNKNTVYLTTNDKKQWEMITYVDEEKPVSSVWFTSKNEKELFKKNKNISNNETKISVKESPTYKNKKIKLKNQEEKSLEICKEKTLPLIANLEKALNFFDKLIKEKSEDNESQELDFLKEEMSNLKKYMQVCQPEKNKIKENDSQQKLEHEKTKDKNIGANANVHHGLHYSESQLSNDECGNIKISQWKYSSNIGTYTIVQVLGIKEKYANLLGRASINVDYGTTSPLLFFNKKAQSWHFNADKKAPKTNGTRKDTRIKHAMECLVEAIRMCQQLQKAQLDSEQYRKEFYKILLFLGTGLHPLQDVFFHTDQYVSNWGNFFLCTGAASHHLFNMRADDAYENNERPVTKETMDLNQNNPNKKQVNQNYSDQKTLVYWCINKFFEGVKDNVFFLSELCERVKNKEDVENLLYKNKTIIDKRIKNMKPIDYDDDEPEFRGTICGFDIYNSVCAAYEIAQKKVIEDETKKEILEKTDGIEKEIKVIENARENKNQVKPQNSPSLFGNESNLFKRPNKNTTNLPCKILDEEKDEYFLTEKEVNVGEVGDLNEPPPTNIIGNFFGSFC